MKALAAFAILTLISATTFANEIAVGLASNFSEVSSSSSNPFGDYFRNGIQLALKAADKKLAQKHLTIKLEEFDYGNSDARVLDAARKAVTSNVVAVVGYNFSSHALLAAPIHQAGQLAMITPSATANRIGSLGPYIHQGCFDNAFMGEALARIAHDKLKASKAAIVVAADCAYCTELAKAFESGFKKNGGTVTVSTSVLVEDKDFSGTIEKLKAQPFDVVLVPNQELLAGRIIAALMSHGIRKPFLGGDGWGNTGAELFAHLDKQSLNGYSVSHWHPEETSTRSKKFVADYNKTFGKSPNDTAVLAYDSMSILIEALLKTQQITRGGVEASLAHMKKFSGVSGHFIFQKNKAPRKSLIVLSTANSKFNVVERIEPAAGAKP